MQQAALQTYFHAILYKTEHCLLFRLLLRLKTGIAFGKHDIFGAVIQNVIS